MSQGRPTDSIAQAIRGFAHHGWLVTSDLGVWGLDVKELGELGKQREISIDIAPLTLLLWLTAWWGVRWVDIVPFTYCRYECSLMCAWLKAILRSPSLGQSQGNRQFPWEEAPHC